MKHKANIGPEGARRDQPMASIKRKEIKPKSKLGKIIFNSKLPDEYSNTTGDGCEYVYGDPLEDFHYCGRPIYYGISLSRRYCEEHHNLCYTTKKKSRLTIL